MALAPFMLAVCLVGCLPRQSIPDIVTHILYLLSSDQRHQQQPAREAQGNFAKKPVCTCWQKGLQYQSACGRVEGVVCHPQCILAWAEAPCS